MGVQIHSRQGHFWMRHMSDVPWTMDSSSLCARLTQPISWVSLSSDVVCRHHHCGHSDTWPCDTCFPSHAWAMQVSVHGSWSSDALCSKSFMNHWRCLLLCCVQSSIFAENCLPLCRKLLDSDKVICYSWCRWLRYTCATLCAYEEANCLIFVCETLLLMLKIILFLNFSTNFRLADS